MENTLEDQAQKIETIKQLITNINNSMNFELLESAMVDFFVDNKVIPNSTQIPPFFQFLAQNIAAVGDIIVFNVNILITLHSLNNTSVKVATNLLLDALYNFASAKELFLTHTSITSYTSDKTILLHTLFYLPSILQRMPSEMLDKLTNECMMNIKYILDIVDQEKETNITHGIILSVISSFLQFFKPNRNTFKIILLLCRNRKITKSIKKCICTFCLAIKSYPTIVMNLTPEEFITYIQVQLPFPLILNYTYLYNKLMISIDNEMVTPVIVEKLLKTLVCLNGDSITAKQFMTLYSALTAIQTNDIDEQRRLKTLFENFIMNKTIKTKVQLYNEIINNAEYKDCLSYILHLIRMELNCFNSRDINESKINELKEEKKEIINILLPTVTYLLDNKEFTSLDKYVIVNNSNDMNDICAFVKFLVILNRKINIITVDQMNQIKSIISTIYDNLLKVRSIVMSGPTQDDIDHVKKIQKICNVNDGNQDLVIDPTSAFEKNTTTIEFVLFNYQSLISFLN